MQICHLIDFTEYIDFGEKFANETIYDVIKDMAPSLDGERCVLSTCRWQLKYKDCPALFKPILTEEGLCFTFNALNSRDIYTEEFRNIFSLLLFLSAIMKLLSEWLLE